MGLFSFIKNNRKKDYVDRQLKDDGPTIFYHEDDYLQVEILPLENLDQLKKESADVENYSKKCFGGFGYTDIYVRSDKNKLPLKLET